MAKTAKVLNEDIKVRFLDGVAEHLTQVGEEVLRVGSNEIALPVLDSEDNEKWLVLTFKVPTGTRQGEAYDGYEMAEDYKMKLENKAIKEQQKAEKAAKAMKEKLRELMEAAGVSKWECDQFTATIGKASESTTFDSKAFQADHPDLYKQYLKKTTRKGSFTQKLK